MHCMYRQINNTIGLLDHENMSSNWNRVSMCSGCEVIQSFLRQCGSRSWVKVKVNIKTNKTIKLLDLKNLTVGNGIISPKLMYIVLKFGDNL